MWKVYHLEDSTYQVVEETVVSDDVTLRDVAFQGTLPECDAWIRLTEGGHM